MPRFRLQFNLFLLACLLCTGLFSISMPVIVAQGDACGDSLPPRLKVGNYAQVTAGTSNNIRIIPSRKGQLLGQVPGGETFKVTNGPKCVEGFNWWQINYKGIIGWTVEATGDEYWLQPYDANKPEMLISTNGTDYEYQGIHFELNPNVAAHAWVSFRGAVVSDPDRDLPQAFAPAGIEFTFTDANDKRLPLSLRIYSVADYVKQEPQAQKALDTLAKQLDEDPGWQPPKDQIPVLSIVRQPKLFRARTAELNFANGVGYRFLTQTSFDVRPIANPIDYRYSGLTYDKQYYVVAEASVTTTLLQESLDLADYGVDFEKQFETYRDGVVNTLTNAKGSEFTPNIDHFDDLIKTLQIHGPAFTVTTGEALQVHYGIMDFTVDNSLAKDVDYQIELANWESMSPLPEHTCFRLQQDPLFNVPFGDQLCIFPALEMGGYVKALQRYLAEKPALDIPDGKTRIPIPFNGASQLIHAQVSYFETDNIQGVRFVTRYAQADYPISGDLLEYNFSGLTRDGLFIIYFEHFTSSERLPWGQPTDEQLSIVHTDPLKYYKSVVDILNLASSSDFKPSLNTLDSVIKSIVIKSS